MPFWYCAGMTLDDFLKNEPTKMSHAAFGKKIGVEQATVTRYVNGERFPSPEIILKIVKATKGKVTAADLVAVSEKAKRMKAEKAEQERAQA